MQLTLALAVLTERSVRSRYALGSCTGQGCSKHHSLSRLPPARPPARARLLPGRYCGACPGTHLHSRAASSSTSTFSAMAWIGAWVCLSQSPDQLGLIPELTHELTMVPSLLASR